MPKRHSSHVIGDKATAAVHGVVTDAGFAAETIKNDYGEDLLVQTSHAGEIDASRLWLQVKGTGNITKHRRRDGSFTYSVPVGHAIKWARSGDPVHVVLWDVEARRGYVTPVTPYEVWRATVRGDATVKLRFMPDDEFTAGMVGVLAWESRVQRYHQLALSLRYNLDLVDEDEAESDDPNGPLTALALDFLRLLGLVEAVGRDKPAWRLAPGVGERFTEAFKDFIGREDYDGDTRRAVLQATIIVVLAAMQPAGVGLPASVITPAVNVLIGLSGIGQVLDEFSANAGAARPGRPV